MGIQIQKATPYIPTQARSGDNNALYRMKNCFVRGSGTEGGEYIEAYGGSSSLSETIPTSTLTGTLAITSGSSTVVGTGTAFLTELHLGQFVLFISTGVS